MTQLAIFEHPDAVEFDLKVVPRAARSAIVGVLGSALKVAVTAPPSAGQANAAVIQLLAEVLRVRPHQVEIVSGHGQPRKRVRVSGVCAGDLRQRLAGR